MTAHAIAEIKRAFSNMHKSLFFDLILVVAIVVSAPWSAILG
jgi:hypothetical protein